MENNIQKFNNEAMELMKDIAGIAATKKSLEKHDKQMRAELLELCERYNIKSIDNEFLKINYVESTKTETIDLKAIENHDPELGEDLFNEYPKITTRKGYVRITPKEVKSEVRG